MKSSKFNRFVVAIAAALTTPVGGAVTSPGFIYDAQLLGDATQSCVAVGVGGTFVGVGPGFTANAQAVFFVDESGAGRLVALGFNSIGDCAYDTANDVLYVTDNAGNLPGALTGDTVFRIPNASVPPVGVRSAVGLELLPAGSIPFAANVALDASGDVYVSDSAGGGLGTVTKIDLPAATTSTFASPFDFAAGLAFDPASGNLMVAETRDGTFDAQIRRFDSTGTELMPLFAAPSYGFGSYDLAYDTDGNLLATGLFAGDVVAFDSVATATPFASGLTYASGASVNAFTGRVEILSSFSGTDEDKSIHRFVPISRLVEGGGSAESDCLAELYGLELVAVAPGDPPKKAICVDGAPCDADGEQNDRCVFPVGFCLDVPDPDLTGCTNGSAINSFSVATKPYSAPLAAVSDTIQDSLPAAGPACFFSSGGIAVPVKVNSTGKRAGKGKIKVQVEAADGRKDGDSVSLVCEPAP
jgi:hypothetical protein